MSIPPEALELVKGWIEKAENDLKNAEHTLKLTDDCPYDTVCFHSQQCAEKYLKALLTLKRIQFPRTHDLTELASLLPPDARLGSSPPDLAEITPYAVEARYPGAWEAIGREEALSAVKLAREVREAVRVHIPKTLL